MKKLLSLSFKQVLLISVAITAFLFTAQYLLVNVYRSKAAVGPNGVMFNFNPSSGNSLPINQNQTTTLTISSVTSSNRISGYDITLVADGVIEFVEASTPSGFQTVVKTISAKQARLAYINSTGVTSELSSTVLIDITFRAPSAGSGSISFKTSGAPYQVVGTVQGSSFEMDSNPPSASFSFVSQQQNPPTNTPVPNQPTNTPVPNQPTNTPVPNQPTNTPAPNQPTNTPTQPPGGGGGIGQTGNVTLNLKLKLQGVLGKPQAGNSLPVKVRLAGPTNTGYQTGTFTADNGGVWSGSVNFSNVTAGSGYTVYVKGGKHVQKKVCVANPSETAGGTYRCSTGSITLAAGSNNLDFSKILMLAGDLTSASVQDGVIDSYDTSFILNNLGKTDPAILEIGDLNFDGVIDTQDRSLVIQSLNVKYDEE